jgi:hypothetical protein
LEQQWPARIFGSQENESQRQCCNKTELKTIKQRKHFMKYLLKIVLLLCVMSGQAWGLERVMEPGEPSDDGGRREGESEERTPPASASAPTRTRSRRRENSGDHRPETARQIFRNKLTRSGRLILPLLNVPIDNNYTTNDSFKSNYKNDSSWATYKQQIQEAFNNSEVEYSATPTPQEELFKTIW